jgi:hypothetical protein
VLAVLHLDPVLRPAAPIGAASALRDQALKAHVAGGAEEIGTDLTLLEWADEDAVRPTRQRAATRLSSSRMFRIVIAAAIALTIAIVILVGAMTAAIQDLRRDQ